MKKTLFIMLLSFSLIFSLPAQASARYATGVFIAASSKTVTVYFDCNDMWADIPSTVFSRQLARTAVSLSAAAYDEENIVSSLESMGYEVIAQRNFGRSATKENHDFVAWTLGRKIITEKGETKNQYILAIRGTEEKGEWYGNFDVGQGVEHHGFSAAGEELMLELGMYITTPLESNHILVTGHSRGGAVANLVAQQMTNSESYALADNIYGYTYATPMVTTQPVNSGNIFNFVNGGDIVTNMPLPSWGYGRNGQTITLADDDNTVRRLNAGLRSVTGEDYSAGFNSDEFNMIFSKLAPTVADYYEEDSNGYSVNELFNDIVPILAGDFSTSDLASIALKSASLGGADAMQYFIEERGNFVQAHSPETYIAWINAMYA